MQISNPIIDGNPNKEIKEKIILKEWDETKNWNLKEYSRLVSIVAAEAKAMHEIHEEKEFINFFIEQFNN